MITCIDYHKKSDALIITKKVIDTPKRLYYNYFLWQQVYCACKGC